MHSFQPSRGRVFVEFLCALAIVASLVGAWRQTQASALLLAAGAAALLGMIRLFDMSRGTPATVEEPQRIGFEPELPAEEAALPGAAQPTAAEEVEAVEPSGEVIEFIEPEGPRTGAGRRKGGSRKGTGRRAAPRKAARIVDISVAEAVDDEAGIDEADSAAAAVEIAVPEPVHVPHAPLFEPEPFVRMPRQAFGRRGRL